RCCGSIVAQGLARALYKKTLHFLYDLWLEYAQAIWPSLDKRKEGKMNKAELIEIAAKEADISKAAAGKALDGIIAAVVKAVSKGDTVTLVGFGTFKSAKRAARTGKNPKTGESIKIPATTVPKFSAGAGFKTAVAGKKKK